mmetsp:Transcript_4277/g.27239  ORF Transcript_4277/g.27239 Transcript_4277/m.27239 type:complete len:155 (+) Transcript_4277:1348-1812(+)
MKGSWSLRDDCVQLFIVKRRAASTCIWPALEVNPILLDNDDPGKSPTCLLVFLSLTGRVRPYLHERVLLAPPRIEGDGEAQVYPEGSAPTLLHSIVFDSRASKPRHCLTHRFALQEDARRERHGSFEHLSCRRWGAYFWAVDRAFELRWSLSMR